jgi:hypothetical protein
MIRSPQLQIQIQIQIQIVLPVRACSNQAKQAQQFPLMRKRYNPK